MKKNSKIKQKISLEHHIDNIQNNGVGEIILTSIDKEGMMKKKTLT